MSDFGPRLYGEPCNDCGYSWTISPSDAAVLLAAIPASYRELLTGASGDERPEGASWNVTAYVAHVADNVRIWSERVAGIAAGSGRIVAYDQDELAAVRDYPALSLDGVLWSLDRAIEGWALIWREVAGRDELVMSHPQMGEQPMGGVIALVAHDAFHHGWDIGRAFGRLSYTLPSPSVREDL